MLVGNCYMITVKFESLSFVWSFSYKITLFLLFLVMAPLKKPPRARKSMPNVSDKENSFLRGLSVFQDRVRRRESLRNLRSFKVGTVS